MQTSLLDPIAIVGIGCRFPGGADHPETFWRLLLDGRDAMVETPPERWDLRRFHDEVPDRPAKVYVRRGGFLKEPIDEFDAAFFGISPREAHAMDPQQRLLLELTWEALEDGGQLPTALRGRMVGVYVGAFTLDYLMLQFRPSNRHLIGPHTASGSTMGVLANRLSHAFDFRGPSLAVDTACSSSLTALNYACHDLTQGACELAVCAGVNLMLVPEYVMAMCKGQFLAPDGRCKTFDARADGYARGEGGGVLILKSLARAEADGDAIYSVIRAIGINQDGHTDGIVSPNPAAQQALLRQVYSQAGIAPGQIAYVEAHGTGTQAGDVAEASALGAVIGQAPERKAPLVVGSVKTNIGHLEAAAGMAAVIKTALTLRRGIIPPSLNFETPNPKIDFNALRLRVPVAVEPWPEQAGPRYAAVNSFGYGGTNVHAVLEEYCAENQDTATEAPERAELLPLSARSSAALHKMAAAYESFLAPGGEGVQLPLRELCGNAALHRTHHDYRLTVSGRSAAQIAMRLAAFRQGSKAEGIAEGCSGIPGRLVFVYTGMGPQWWAMGQELYRDEPVFREAVDAVDASFSQIAGWSLRARMLASEADSRTFEVRIAQPANFCLQVALTALWQSWGVVPGAVVGHSAGEIAAAYAAGALDLEQAVNVIFTRARLQHRMNGKGRMLAVGIGMPDATALLAGLEDRVSLAASNSPAVTVLAGEVAALKRIASELEAQGKFQHFLDGEVAYHSYQMDPLRAEFLAALDGLLSTQPAIPLISTVTGAKVTTGALDAVYWWANLRQPVRFNVATKALLSDGPSLFLEIGPHPVLGAHIRKTAQQLGVNTHVFASQHQRRPQRETMLDALGGLHSLGFPVQWSLLYPRGKRHLGALPTYPWERERFFHESPISREDRLGPSGHPMLGERMLAPGANWEIELNRNFQPFINDHRVQDHVVFPGAAYVEAGLAIGNAEYGAVPLVIENLCLVRMLALNVERERILRTEHYPREFRYIVRSGSYPERNDWTTHATGRLYPGGPHSHGGMLDLAKLRDRCSEALAGEEFYKQLSVLGLNYGPAFRCVRRIHRGKYEVLAEVAMDAEAAVGAASYLVHPALLDCAFQTLIVAAANGVAGLFLPESIDQVRFFRSPGDQVLVHTSLTDATATMIRGNLQLCDASGEILVEVTGLRCSALPARDAAQANLLYEFRWQPAVESDPEPLPVAPWLVVAEDDHFAAAFRRAADAAGLPVALVSPTRIIDSQPRTGVLWLTGSASPNQAPDASACARGLALIQALAATGQPERLILVTRGAMAAIPGDEVEGVALAPLWGLARVAMNEYPGLGCILVDLPSLPEVADWTALIAQCLQDGAEREVAVRGGRRLVNRLQTLTSAEREKHQLREQSGSHHTRIHLLPGADGGLVWQQGERRAPGAKEIELRVHAVALGPQDLTTAARPVMAKDGAVESPFGYEAVGEVEAIGTEVRTLAPGDRVVIAATGGLLGSFVYVDIEKSLVIPHSHHGAIADGLGWLSYMVAMHALDDLAHLKSGERLLIHAEANGWAEAAIRHAHARGAEVFVTAANPEHRAFLATLGATYVLDSSNIDFANTVRSATGGTGVDVVLCATGGAILHQSLALLGDGGRMIRIRQTADESETVEIPAGNRLIASLDVRRLLTLSAARRHSLVDRINAAICAGAFTLLNQRFFSAAKVTDAFQTALKPTVFGQVVVRMDHETVLVRPLRSRLFRSDATYLVTGGLGGFGLEVARWLAKHGARHLALAGRTGASRPEATQLLSELTGKGVEARVFPVDVGNAAMVAALLADIRASMPPLAGVFHCAAALDDGLISDLSPDRMERVLRPKALGAWHLHQATANDTLEVFILFSSIASVLGNRGQGNYAASNAYLDALAHYRQTKGLPAMTVNWGPLADVGMAARDPKILGHLARLGLTALTLAEALQFLTEALTLRKTPQVIVANIDHQLWRHNAPSASQVAALATTEARSGNGLNNFRTTLLAIPRHQRRRHLEILVAETVARVLGLTADRLDIHRSISNYGLDSLLALEVVLALETSFGISFSAVHLFTGPSIRDFAVDILKRTGIEGALD